MPVTAKLSQKFYEKFGDDIATELVNWFNMVDDSYRTQLRELNELNFARFDAKLEERFAKSDAKWEKRFLELEARWEKRFTELEARWEKRFTELEVRWEKRFTELEAKLEVRLAALETTIHRELRMQTRWLLGVLTVQFAAIIAALLSR